MIERIKIAKRSFNEKQQYQNQYDLFLPAFKPLKVSKDCKWIDR